MDSLWFMLFSSALCGGYAMSRLKTTKSKIGRGLLWVSIVVNGIAIVVTAWVLTLFLGGQWS